MFSNKSFYILALSVFMGLVLFESVASRPKNYCPNLRCKANANATLVQNGCADLAQYNFTDPFAGSAINSTSCCNELTACYQHCTNSKHGCDEQFEKCRKKVAKQNSSTPKTKGKKQHHSSEEIDDNDCALFESLRKQACIC